MTRLCKIYSFFHFPFFFFFFLNHKYMILQNYSYLKGQFVISQTNIGQTHKNSDSCIFGWSMAVTYPAKVTAANCLINFRSVILFNSGERKYLRTKFQHMQINKYFTLSTQNSCFTQFESISAWKKVPKNESSTDFRSFSLFQHLDEIVNCPFKLTIYVSLQSYLLIAVLQFNLDIPGSQKWQEKNRLFQPLCVS